MSVFLVGFDTSLTVFLYFYIARNDVKYPRPSTLFVCGSVVPPDFEAKRVGEVDARGVVFLGQMIRLIIRSRSDASRLIRPRTKRPTIRNNQRTDVSERQV